MKRVVLVVVSLLGLSFTALFWGNAQAVRSEPFTEPSTPTATVTPIATATVTPTSTATVTPTMTATVIPTMTATPMPTPTATWTPTAAATVTPTTHYEVSISPSSDAKSGDQGTTVTYTLQVRNLGTQEEAYSLSVSGNSWPSEVSPATIGPLQPGASAEVTVRVSIPSAGVVGATDTALVAATDHASAAATLVTTANDYQVPAVTELTINGGALTSTARQVVLSLSASDPDGSVAWMSFSNDASAWSEWEAYSESAGSILTEGDGEKTVYARVRDLAGHVSLPVSDTIELDTTAGSEYGLSINDGALFTNQVEVTLSLGARPGTAQVQVSNDGGFAGAQWEPYTSTKSWEITRYGDYVIPRVVYVRYRDVFGNISATFSDDIILDVTPPTGSVGFAEAAGLRSLAGTRATLVLEATDDVSGVGHMQLSNISDFSDAVWQEYEQTYPWTLDEKLTVYARFRDDAGNVSEVYSAAKEHHTYLPLTLCRR